MVGGYAWLGGLHSGEMATEDTTNRSSQFLHFVIVVNFEGTQTLRAM